MTSLTVKIVDERGTTINEVRTVDVTEVSFGDAGKGLQMRLIIRHGDNSVDEQIADRGKAFVMNPAGKTVDIFHLGPYLGDNAPQAAAV